jgi:hypothetical protein
MLRHVALVRTDVLKEHIASLMGVTRIGELGMSAVTSNQNTLHNVFLLLVTANIPSLPTVTLMTDAICASYKSHVV